MNRADVEALAQKKLSNFEPNKFALPAKQQRVQKAISNGWVLAEEFALTLEHAAVHDVTSERPPVVADEDLFDPRWEQVDPADKSTWIWHGKSTPKKRTKKAPKKEAAPAPPATPSTNSKKPWELHLGRKAATHNGTFTVVSPKGGHRTFRIRTEDDFRDRSRKTRFIGMLTGPDNTSNYQTIGEVGAGGNLRVWKRFWKTQTEESARLFWALLTEGEHKWAAGCELRAATSCRRCNRRLTDPVSIESGIGPICRAKGL